LYLALVVGGLGVALVGFIDDRRNVSAPIRLAVHVAAAGWGLVCIGGLPPLQIGTHVVSFGWGGYVIGVLLIVWVLNLFNFMDGIDGIAASEAVFIAGAAAMLSSIGDADPELSAVALLFGAACAGFLVWNWPPASIFMGDVGSGYLGYFLVVMALAHARSHPHALLVWLLLGGIFFVDATVTLVRRLARREAVYVAHRSHAYQWLARRWRSHRRVTLTVLCVNVGYLLPCAYLASTFPAVAALIAVAGLVPVVIWLSIAGAGRREHPML
jgi:Fuc2NAc and GlcNAc transferase